MPIDAYTRYMENNDRVKKNRLMADAQAAQNPALPGQALMANRRTPMQERWDIVTGQARRSGAAEQARYESGVPGAVDSPWGRGNTPQRGRTIFVPGAGPGGGMGYVTNALPETITSSAANRMEPEAFDALARSYMPQPGPRASFLDMQRKAAESEFNALPRGRLLEREAIRAEDLAGFLSNRRQAFRAAGRRTPPAQSGTLFGSPSGGFPNGPYKKDFDPYSRSNVNEFRKQAIPRYAGMLDRALNTQGVMEPTARSLADAPGFRPKQSEADYWHARAQEPMQAYLTMGRAIQDSKRRRIQNMQRDFLSDPYYRRYQYYDYPGSDPLSRQIGGFARNVYDVTNNGIYGVGMATGRAGRAFGRSLSNFWGGLTGG